MELAHGFQEKQNLFLVAQKSIKTLGTKTSVQVITLKNGMKPI